MRTAQAPASIETGRERMRKAFTYKQAIRETAVTPHPRGNPAQRPPASVLRNSRARTQAVRLKRITTDNKRHDNMRGPPRHTIRVPSHPHTAAHPGKTDTRQRAPTRQRPTPPQSAPLLRAQAPPPRHAAHRATGPDGRPAKARTHPSSNRPSATPRGTQEPLDPPSGPLRQAYTQPRAPPAPTPPAHPRAHKKRLDLTPRRDNRAARHQPSARRHAGANKQAQAPHATGAARAKRTGTSRAAVASDGHRHGATGGNAQRPTRPTRRPREPEAGRAQARLWGTGRGALRERHPQADRGRARPVALPFTLAHSARAPKPPSYTCRHDPHTSHLSCFYAQPPLSCQRNDWPSRRPLELVLHHGSRSPARDHVSRLRFTCIGEIFPSLYGLSPAYACITAARPLSPQTIASPTIGPPPNCLMPPLGNVQPPSGSSGTMLATNSIVNGLATSARHQRIAPFARGALATRPPPQPSTPRAAKDKT
ncbi:hypothetical protein C7M84_022128 [Penaeus vannamei]|uniref:Uncharacterized protein n=1 Tax=Penaeus vannamei TaxID=6689 RepID=A0A3R7PF39_PENVA|nr:hypothetical protein C7M84_022128 [Penaeus vannamei]